MSFCTQCGQQLPEGAQFCTGCGAPTTSGRQAPPAAPHESAPPSANPFRAAMGPSGGTGEPITQKLPTSGHHPPSAPVDPHDDATHVAAAPTQGIPQQAPQRPVAPDDDSTHVAPATQALPQNPPQAPQAMPQQASADPHDDATRVAPTQAPTTPQGSGSLGASYANPAATQPHREQSQQYPSAQPQSYPSGHPQQYGSAQPNQQYGSVQPQQYGTDHSGFQPGYSTSNPSQGFGYDAQASPAGFGTPGIALDWKALTPGLIRLALAVALSMTALGNWWVYKSQDEWSAGSPATHSDVLALIGCIGVTLAALVQIPLLPQFVGRTIPPIGRFAVRAVLCLPALVAVVIAIVTTLGSPDSNKQAAAGVTMLAMAIGFALVGLDDGHEALPQDTVRWAAVAFAGLGIILTLVQMFQFISTDDSNLSGKMKWLVAALSLLFVVALGALIIGMAFSRIFFGHGLLVAFAGAAALSLLFRGWVQSNGPLFATSVLRNGHGAPLIALALALSTAAGVAAVPGDTAADHPSVARRLTSWVVPGYGLAAIASLVTALVYVGARTDGTPGGVTWFLVLLFIAALAYAACAFLLRTNPMGRLVAVGTTAVITLTILITIAASQSAGSAGEFLSEGAYLWVPVLAACTLTIPPSVRSVAGPLLPNTGTKQPAQQNQFGQSAPQQAGPFPAQQGQFGGPQQGAQQFGQFDGQGGPQQGGQFDSYGQQGR